MTAASRDIATAVQLAADTTRAWLQELPEWPIHPTNPSGSVASHFGPTILSEHDCILHFARRLSDAGVRWEDMHAELSPAQWLFKASASTRPPRIDLAVIARERLLGAGLPVSVGDLRFDAVFEFALASNYWQFGTGSPRALLAKVNADIAKVAEYLRRGFAHQGYVVVVEECDHGFASGFETETRARHGVDVLLLRRWC